MKLPELPGYQYDELIGEGACGVAVRCTHEGQDTRVVKFLKAQSINPGMVASCIRALSGKERHPGIAEVYHYNFTDYPYFYITPFFGERDPRTGEWSSRSLDEFIGEIHADDALILIDQIAEALAFSHRLDVIHGGLKPGNIFLSGNNSPDQWQVKITDWGQGYLTGLQYLEMGDLGFYASPEQLDNGDPAHGAGKRWDVYAFGVVAFLLLTGRFPRLENQYQAYLRENEGFSHVPAAAFGTVLDQPEKYVDWIVDEERIVWPNPAGSEIESKRRQVIERCLSVDPRERFPDMRDVVAAFSECDHLIAIADVERKAAEGRQRVLKRAARWQKAAAGAALLSLFGAGAGAFFFAEWKNEQKHVAETREGAEKHIKRWQTEAVATEEEKKEIEELVKSYKAQSDDIRERMHEEMVKQMTRAREMMISSQENADRFFELILETRDSDVPGFAEIRSKVLKEASGYYEELVKTYGDAPETVEAAARAARFLGEINFELAEYSKAESSFVTSKIKMEKALAGTVDARPDLIRALAIVNTRLAEIAGNRKQPEAGLIAIEEAMDYWVQVPMQDNGNIEPAIRTGEALILKAELFRKKGDYDNAKKSLQDAIRIYLALREHSGQDYRVIGGLAKATAATGDIMRLSGEVEDALESYKEAAELFADAIELNAAVDDYQLGFAIVLTEVALAEDDVEKLTAAAGVLGEIAALPENRHRIPIFTALAQTYGALANKQRDGNQPASAIEWETKAIAFLQPLVADGGPGAAEELRYALAERRCSLANLQSDRGNHAESRDTLRSANTLIEQLLAIDSANPEYRRLYAQAQGQLGYASVQAGDKDAAKKHYQTALGQWQAYISANPQDDQAVQALEWVKSQLDGVS